MLTFKNLAGNFRLFKTLGTTLKRKSKLRDFDPKGREGSENNKRNSLIRKRENHLRGEGLTPNVPFYLGTLLLNFAYFL